MYDYIKSKKGFSRPEIILERKILSAYNDLIKVPFSDLVNAIDKNEEFVIDSRRGKMYSQTLLINKDKIYVSVYGYLRYFNIRENQNYKTYKGFIKSSNGDIYKINKTEIRNYELQIKQSGDIINFHESWIVTNIIDKITFVSTIIKHVPNNSVWYVEGIFDSEINLALSSYRISDNKNIKLISRIANENILKIILNETSKRIISQNIYKWDLAHNFYHTQIYDEDKIYLLSRNRFTDMKTWVSFDFPRSVLNDLADDNVIKFQEAS